MASSSPMYLQTSTPSSHHRVQEIPGQVPPWEVAIPSLASWTLFFHIGHTSSWLPVASPTAVARMEARTGEPQWWQAQSCFVTGSRTSHLALKAQERLHLDTRQKRSKPGRTNMPVVCSRQQVTRGSPTSLSAKQMQYIWEVTVNQINTAAEPSLEVARQQKHGART